MNELIIEKSYEIDGSIVRHEFYSKLLDNQRSIDIYLPPDYEDNTDEYYPVIYMHDGNNLFDPTIAFGDVHWEVDTTIEKLIKIGALQKIIVVGIHNTMGRDYEYTWTEMQNEATGELEGGGGERYAEFIVSELKPFIDENYRTLTDRENTATIGSSLGGLISLYLGLYYPQVFSKIGAMSPSLWWADGLICDQINEMSPDLKIWLDMGTGEDLSRDQFLNVMEGLRNKGYNEGEKIVYLEDKGVEHSEQDWAKRFHLPLLFFFKK